MALPIAPCCLATTATANRRSATANEMTSNPARFGAGAVRLALVLATTLLLLVPALFNGAPWLFPDSLGYFRAGEATVSKIAELFDQSIESHGVKNERVISIEDRAKDGISNARSPFYGTIFVLLTKIFGDWGLVVTQSIIASAYLYFASYRMFAAKSTFLTQVALALAIGLSALAGLAAFSGLAMPDVFTPLMLLALAILLGRHGSGLRIGWLILLLAALLFHKAHLAIAMLVVAFALILQLLRRRPLGSLFPVVIVIALGWLGHFAVGVVVERVSGQPLHNPPFALARVVADGTASLYLADVCPEAGLLLCRYRDRLPMPPDAFLWSSDPNTGLYRTLPLEEQRIVSAEAGTILRGILITHPLEQVEASFRNVSRQLMTLGVSEFQQRPIAPDLIAKVPPMGGLLEGWAETRIGSNRMPLDGISRSMRLIYTASTLAVLAAFVQILLTRRHLRKERLSDPRVEIAAWLMFGVLINAFVTGVISGVFERYQGRVAWVLPMVAIGLWCVLLDQANRTRATTGGEKLPAYPDQHR